MAASSARPDPDVERIAHVACRSLRGADREDLLQEARLSAWLHADLPPAARVLRARGDAIDALRRWTHHRVRSRQVHDVTSLDALIAEPHTLDPVDPVVEHGLTGRHAIIASMLAAGATKRMVARRLGVDPSRVTHLIAAMRPTITT